jgi:hypothetical protein
LEQALQSLEQAWEQSLEQAWEQSLEQALQVFVDVLAALTF